MSSASAPSSRVAFIDWLRGFSILLMIETHVFNSLLKPFLMEEGWFHVLNFFNGLVAPSFLFVSGWAFVVASTRKLADLQSFGPAFWQQLRRIALIWVLGHLLHLPGFALSVLRRADAAVWQSLLQVDVLHCIAAGLLALFAIRLLVKTEAAFGVTLRLTALLVVFATPSVWSSKLLERLSPAVSGYWVEHAFSLFPMFPWLGFMMFGGACAIDYSKANAAARTLRFMRRMAISGIILIGVGYGFSSYGFPWFYGSRNVRAHPVFFGLRAGYVLLGVWICWQLQKFKAFPSGWLITLSRESLLVYVAHIVFLYHFPMGDSTVVRSLGKSLSAWECTAMSFAVMFLMWAMAHGWGWLKSHHKRASQFLSYVAGVGAAIVFVAR